MDVDLLIRGGRVVDGTGNPWFWGDVAVRGDRIVAVTPPGRIDAGQARQVVEAGGAVVCPGFIDIQSHSIHPLMRDGRSVSKIAQGVTTEIMGEGWTPAPFGGRIREPIPRAYFATRLPEWEERARQWRRFRDWLEAMAERGVSPNIGAFVAGGTLREYVKGFDMTPATPDEVAAMRRLAAEAMEDGAFGVAYALIYPPDAYASTEELIEICREVQRFGGIYITHIRSEAARLFEALEEAIRIGAVASLPVEIYHLKASGRRHWWKFPSVIARIERARRDGIDVTADVYPYTAAGTGLASVLPPWVAAGGRFFENLRDPEVRRRIRQELERPSDDWESLGTEAGPESIMPVGMRRPELRRYVGLRLSEIAAERGQDWIDAAIDLLLEEERNVFTIYFLMDEENVRLALQQPWIKIATDAGGLDPEWARAEGPVHPRAYGTYPRVLGRYVREQRALGLEEAIRKMTSAVADRLGLRERGQVRAGFYADLVVFDPDSVADRATFEDPHQLPVGIRHVWVNGTQVLREGVHTGALPGRVVTGPARV
ncbi:MAG: D-aminoacylase [Thermomicrobium sp.]|nr:D-aminoacylase [Thermomicrobium sp.]MDW8059551.1 D-aminoacylase [Thermomicrobium sp.]